MSQVIVLSINRQYIPIIYRDGSKQFHKGLFCLNRISKEFVLRKIKRYRGVNQSENFKT